MTKTRALEISTKGVTFLKESEIPKELAEAGDELQRQITELMEKFVNESKFTHRADIMSITMTAASNVYLNTAGYGIESLNNPAAVMYSHDEVTKMLLEMIKEAS